jgi:4'-phosphopantetheinyl transferase
MNFRLRAWPGAADVDLWLVELDESSDADAPTLDATERARAARFAFARDRRRWVASRGALRQVLGERVGAAPASLRFREGPFGKPELGDHADCAFSISHSGAFALIAVAGADTAAAPHAIGVDLEVVKPMPDREQLLRTLFTRDEREAVESAAADARDARFLAGWTRKEACLKALGYGLQIEPASFSVGLTAQSPAGDDPPHRVDIETPDGPRCVSVNSLSLPGPLVGALARGGAADVARGGRR